MIIIAGELDVDKLLIFISFANNIDMDKYGEFKVLSIFDYFVNTIAKISNNYKRLYNKEYPLRQMYSYL